MSSTDEALQQRNVGSQSDFDRGSQQYKTASAPLQVSDAEIASARAAISAKATTLLPQRPSMRLN
ncbi:MAG: hypothetical protein R3C56_34075 [Pirellulaceae bacterium]